MDADKSTELSSPPLVGAAADNVVSELEDGATRSATSSPAVSADQEEEEEEESGREQQSRPSMLLVPTRSYSSSEEDDDTEDEDDRGQSHSNETEAAPERFEEEDGGTHDADGNMGDAVASVDKDATRNTDEERFRDEVERGGNEMEDTVAVHSEGERGSQAGEEVDAFNEVAASEKGIGRDASSILVEESAIDKAGADAQPSIQSESQLTAAPHLDALLVAAGKQPSDAPTAQMNEQTVSSDARPKKSSASPSSTPKQKAKQKVKSSTAQPSRAIEDMAVSIESLRKLAEEHNLETAHLDKWSVRPDGKIVDPDKKKYDGLREALRAYSFSTRGSIPREDIYYLAILRRKLAEKDLPLQDGPITVVSLGEIFPEPLFYSTKKLFPIGYETVVNVQVSKPSTQLFRLQCKIVFRSYVASKAWKKAFAHFESLTSDEFETAIEGARFTPSPDAERIDFLTAASGEDGFGLLRRNITRLLEGLHQVLKCKDYQFWEERHIVNAEVHSKLRAKLKKQVKEYLQSQREYPKEEMKRVLSQDALILEHSRTPEELLRIQQQEEKERREAEKRSVREAARKLLEIEMKAQEDAKEAQRREKEERKNAILEAKMEVVRQKEARKEAARLAKEEEKRIREEEKEMKRALKEEEKRKKVEEKENSMKRRIEELRERRKMREEQKSILENGVVTTSADSEIREGGLLNRDPHFSDGFLKKKRAAASSPQSHTSSARKQHLALLKFVDEESDRRRKMRLMEKKYAVEKGIWTSVKEEYLGEKKHACAFGSTSAKTSVKENAKDVEESESKELMLSDFLAPAVELDQIPAESHGDLLFAWDFISTFADCLRLTAIPSLSMFLKVLALSDGSSPVGDGKFEEDSLGRVYAGFHAEIVKVLVAEYFPILQTGTRLEEFYRTRPLNAFSWPELARQVCLLSIEVKHPSVDDQLIKSLKGSKSYRDDSVVLPLRNKLQKRGIDLLNGVQYQESSTSVDQGPEDLQPSSREAVARQPEATASGSSSSKFYGVVLVGGISSKIELEERDAHLAVKTILPDSDDSSGEHARKESSSSMQDLEIVQDDNASSLAVGDTLISINGISVKGMALSAFSSLLNGISTPHGLLLSSSIPPVKAPLKHIPTTMNSSKLKRCAHVLKLLRAKEIAAPFNQPVDGDLYPDYYSGIITEPMDLGTIAEKLEDEDYENDDDVESFVDDVTLVWKNCYTYNSAKAEISNLARKLSAIFNRLMNDWVYTNVSRHLVSSEEDHCRNCQTNHVKDRLLLCDRCDAAYHTFCLSSPLTKVPTGEWFCPLCINDPSFSPDQFKKKVGDSLNGAGKGGTLEPEIEYSEFEKRVLSVIGVLSKENYSDLTVGDRVLVLRVLCELLQGTAIVQSVYQSIEEKAIDARRNFGEALADLNREWDLFVPSQPSHAIERTNKFFIDGVEHDLTDELLEYLKDKALAELDGRPIPPLPESAISRLCEQHGVQRFGNEGKLKRIDLSDDSGDDVSGDSDSEGDEEQLIESFGDHFLVSSQREKEGCASDVTSFPTPKPVVCEFCGFEDGILNGALISCRRCPVTHQIAPLNQFDIPGLVAGGDSEQVFTVRRLTTQECAVVHLTDVSEGVQLSGNLNPGLANPSSQGGFVSSMDADPDEPSLHDGFVIYAINDRVVFGMRSAEILLMIRRAEQPIFVYLTSLPGDALKASLSIVKYHSIPLCAQFEVSQSAVFVQSFQHTLEHPFGYAELCQQILPGDMILMINEVPMWGKEATEVDQLLQLEHELDAKYIVAMRAPCGKMKQALENWNRTAYDIATQQAKRTTLRDSLHPSKPEPRGQVAKRKQIFDVKFFDGPLGLALSLEHRGVVVKSLNDQPNGVLGQASLSRQICRGDLVERVNGQTYGPLRDLSQFTSFLLALPRPLVITFSREVQVEEGAQKAERMLMSVQLENSMRNVDFLRESLGLSTSSSVKTFRIDSIPLPFMVSEFLGSICVVSTNGYVACESMDASGVPTSSIAIGDCIVGLNGKSTIGLSWVSLQSLCAEMLSATPLYVHLVSHTRKTSVLTAHKACAQAANVAWSECEHLRPKIDQASNFELFLNWTVVPRTLSLGRCRGGYRYYRFYSDRQRIYLQSEKKQWFVCDSAAAFSRLLSYLDQDDRDSAIARRIRASFHHFLHGKDSSSSRQKRVLPSFVDAQQFCCEYSELPYLSSGPFALKKETSVSVSEFEIERHVAHVSYRGRKFCIGEFSTQQQAEAALQHAESAILSTGYHVASSGESADSFSALFPRLPIPILTAESVVKRPFARKYEYTGGVLDSTGKPKPVPLSQSVYHVLRRGLRAELIPSIPAAPLPGPQVTPNAYDQMKRKLSASLHANEQAKRSKYQVEGGMSKSRPVQPGSSSSGGRAYQLPVSTTPSYHDQEASALKRSLQPLVDQGRAMLAAWNQFAVSPTVQASNGLAYTCLSSFEEVKKAVSRVLVDPNGVLPDPKTFVCLHHAFVVGLICAMATQSLTSSRKTNGDSALVKQIADAFATAILSCMDPSTMLRARALSGFAIVAKHCEHPARPNDLSEELHHVANFALQFFRTTQYLADGNFEDTSKCRPIFSSLSRGVETLPASFLQQLKLLENIREAFVRKMGAQPATTTSASSLRSPIPPSSLKVSPYGVVPQPSSARLENARTPPPPQSNSFPPRIPENAKEVYIHVTFGHGPLGIVINYSNRGAIVVTEFSSDNGVMGQAQASGKVFIGDEIFSVNGNFLESIGMEGFKATVASGGRPLQVTFRRYVSPIEPIGLAQSENGVNLRRQAQNAASAFEYAPVSTTNTGHQAQYTATMSQRQQPSIAPYESPQVAAGNDGYFAGADGSAAGMGGASLYSQPQAPAAVYNNLSDNMTPFPFDSAPTQPSGSMSATSYSMPVPPVVSPYMGNMPTPYSSGPSSASIDVLPALYDEPGGAALPASNQWRSSPMRNYGMDRNMAPIGGYSNGEDININAGLPMGGMLSQQQFTLPSGYPSQGQRAPSLPSMPQRANGASYTGNAPAEYAAFVAPNDPNIAQDDGQISYYDANGTTYRSGFDFVIDTSASTPSAADGVSDVETELASPSVSQMTTPVQSDTEGGDGNSHAQRERHQQDLARATGITSALRETTTPYQGAAGPGTLDRFSASATSVPTIPSSSVQTDQLQTLRTQEDENTDAAALGRRSTRVPKKITSNIADMYNPEFARNAGNQDGAVLEQTDGEVGELATELLEGFHATIRRAKPGVSRSIIFLKAQLLTMEAAIPRDAFRAGRWGRPIRAAWAEMVYGCDSSYSLLEAILFLESNIEAEWLDSCWKASPLQTARNALASATIALAAMRLFALDDALSYVRMRKATKRKNKAPSTTAGFASTSQITAASMEPQESEVLVTHLSQLPFMSRLTPGTIELANKILHRIHVGQRDKSMSPYMYRNAKAEVAAITSLSDPQIEQWIKLYSQQTHQQQPSRLTVATSGFAAHGANTAASGRQSNTPKRKYAGAPAAPGSPSATERPTRKRKNTAGPATNNSGSSQPQFVELRCFQMKSPSHQFHSGVVDTTLKQRLELVLTTLLKNELALAFAEPVNPKYVPGYSDIIKHPMDLGTIKARIARGFYEQRPAQVVRDVNLVWENCFAFNRLDAEISKCANRLRSIFNRLFEEWISGVPASTPVAQLSTEDQCRGCRKMEGSDSMLLCDSCDAAYHIYCLNPPLAAIPAGNWYCPRCPLERLRV